MAPPVPTSIDPSQMFSHSTGGAFGRPRAPAEDDAFFTGLEVVPPGLGRVAGWWA